MRSQFDVKDPEEQIVLPFDFSRDLAGEALLVASATVGIAVYQGSDSAPISLVQLGAANEQNGIVYIGVQGGEAGVDYDVTCRCDTDGGRRLKISGILPVRTL